MTPVPVIAIIDIGKTNKKIFLFDENYTIVFEDSVVIPETFDEDNFPCEDLDGVRRFVAESLHSILSKLEFDVKAINCCSYGASLIHINEQGQPVTPLYNYLKPYPEIYKTKFYECYGGEELVSNITASPVLGNLNSGMQLYFLKHARPGLFNQIHFSLHLPQYISYLITGNICSDITSIGCHTNLWDFKNDKYHYWVEQEGINQKLAPVKPCDEIVTASLYGRVLKAGVGLHDSSAALIPYLINSSEPFILISTGTWCISLNPFNHDSLTYDDLKNDCLSYLSFKGKPVKASRIFAGNEHEEQVERMAQHYNNNKENYRNIQYNPAIISSLRSRLEIQEECKEVPKQTLFPGRNLNDYHTHEEAYHQLMLDIMDQQYVSTKLIAKGTPVKRILVDGGFSKNEVYMNLLANAFVESEVFAACMPQGSALGAALAIHESWNHTPLQNDILGLKYYKNNTVSE